LTLTQAVRHELRYLAKGALVDALMCMSASGWASVAVLVLATTQTVSPQLTSVRAALRHVFAGRSEEGYVRIFHVLWNIICKGWSEIVHFG
jgi:hypothetical protein